MNFAIAVAAIICAITARSLYWHFVQKIPLFELAEPRFVAATLKWLPDQQLARTHSRGGMTRHQWRKLQSRLMQDIDASLGTKNGRGAATELI